MKKKLIILIIITIILTIILGILVNYTYKSFKAYAASQSFLNSSLKFQEANEKTIFSINKITYFSNCNAEISTNSNSSFTISDLYQYTDIAIFLNPNSENLTSKNTIKSVILENIKFSLPPSIGKPSLYYKNINDFAKPTFLKENLINEAITFYTTSEDKIDYTKPILYNNCANPITLCYVNSGIQDKLTLSNNVSNLSHDGTLLKKCGITLNSIACKISFIVTITNYLNETYSCPITLNIPLSTESNTIYDGNLTLKDSTNYKFIRID